MSDRRSPLVIDPGPTSGTPQANLAWAVQHRYTAGRGELVERRDAWLKIAPVPTPPGDLPRYGVQTDVPNYWFPLVPEPLRPGAIRFRLVKLSGNDPAAAPAGQLIETGQWLHEEEVPRDGAWVQRRPVLSRWFDGSWHAWVRREKNPGAGESSSGLAFVIHSPATAIRPRRQGSVETALLPPPGRAGSDLRLIVSPRVDCF